MAVAIPTISDYGKMRVCEYLPIAVAEYDDTGHVKEDIDYAGFEDEYLIDYAGKVNNNDVDNYTINFTNANGIDRSAIAQRIFAMAGYTE